MDAEIALLQLQPYHLSSIRRIAFVLGNCQAQTLVRLRELTVVVLLDRKQRSTLYDTATESFGGNLVQVEFGTLTGPVEHNHIERIVGLGVANLATRGLLARYDIGTCALIALPSSPTTSRLGPILAAQNGVSFESHIEKPSWCSATMPANCAAHAKRSRFLIFDFDLIQRHKKATKYPAETPRSFRLFLLSLRPKRNAEKP